MFLNLGDRFDIFAVDQRGHGRTTLAAEPQGHRSMALFGDDLRRIKAALAPYISGRAFILAGHSLGGVAAAKAAAGDETVAAIRLIEPVAMPDAWNAVAATPLWPLIAPHVPLVRAAARRRSRWPDRQAVLDSYARKPFFAGWESGVLADYLEDGIVEEVGGVRLACAPAWEAANFAAQANDLWGAVAQAQAPVSVLAARHPSSTVPGSAVARFRRLGARIERVDGATHLIPFENPARAAQFLGAAT
jgi:pimeloyl-ACP methyl ester carboxylesterase